jgi:hypothetical protein
MQIQILTTRFRSDFQKQYLINKIYFQPSLRKNYSFLLNNLLI